MPAIAGASGELKLWVLWLGAHPSTSCATERSQSISAGAAVELNLKQIKSQRAQGITSREIWGCAPRIKCSRGVLVIAHCSGHGKFPIDGEVGGHILARCKVGPMLGMANPWHLHELWGWEGCPAPWCRAGPLHTHQIWEQRSILPSTQPRGCSAIQLLAPSEPPPAQEWPGKGCA